MFFFFFAIIFILKHHHKTLYYTNKLTLKRYFTLMSTLHFNFLWFFIQKQKKVHTGKKSFVFLPLFHSIFAAKMFSFLLKTAHQPHAPPIKQQPETKETANNDVSDKQINCKSKHSKLMENAYEKLCSDNKRLAEQYEELRMQHIGLCQDMVGHSKTYFKVLYLTKI